MFDGYSEARNLDKLINKMLEENPISIDNVSQWSLFARILSANSNILLDMCQPVYREKIRRRNGKE